MIKYDFTPEERYGLTQEEYKVGRLFLRKHKTAGKIPPVEAGPLFELYMIGYTFSEIAQQYPQYPLGKIILTACLGKWALDREKMASTLRDRVRAKVVKTVLEQVDFMSLLLAVNNAENVEKMRKYVMDPKNNPKPDFAIDSMKDYKEVMELFHRFLLGSTNVKGKKEESALFSALEPAAGKSDPGQPIVDDDTPANMLDQAVGDEGGNT